MKMRPDSHSLETIFRREAGRVLATLIRLLGDFDRAEEARQEAFAAAIEQWPVAGVPENPGVWLIRTARNKGIDRIRREALFRDKVAVREAGAAGDFGAAGEIAQPEAVAEAAEETIFGDDRLRLIFTCCHPALSRAAAGDATDWPQIVGLYEVLLRLHPTPVVELIHAVAVSMVDGPARALTLIDSLAARLRQLEYRG